jgi:hypothetical protein
MACVMMMPLVTYSGLNIALHAQVSPRGKIVGSVITTDGEIIVSDISWTINCEI